MLEAYELKKQLIEGLKQFLSNCANNKYKYNTYKQEIPLKSIKELLPFVGESTCFYFKSPDAMEYLGLGELALFNHNLDFYKVEKLTNGNPELIIFSATPFNTSLELKGIWEQFKDHHLFLPQFTFEKSNGKTFININILDETFDNAISQMELLTRLERVFSFIHRDSKQLEPIKEELIPQEKGWDEMIETSIKEFKETNLSKVVLARSQSITYKKEVDAFSIFNNFKSSDNLFEIFFHIEHGPSFISFTPERLFISDGHTVSIDAIAGTLKKSESTDGSELLSSLKDLEEHRFVSDFISSGLHELGGTVSKEFTEVLLTLPSLYHIQTRLSAHFKERIPFNKLLKQFHPTPAVGGFPRRDAIKFIEKYEPIDRGLYAGALGITSRNNTTLAVGIRSLLINENKIHFFGGAGVVDKSDSTKEWLETTAKIESVQCMM